MATRIELLYIDEEYDMSLTMMDLNDMFKGGLELVIRYATAIKDGLPNVCPSKEDVIEEVDESGNLDFETTALAIVYDFALNRCILAIYEEPSVLPQDEDVDLKDKAWIDRILDGDA